VCGIKPIDLASPMVLRGVGSMTRDGFVIIDRTCPVVTSKDDELPAMVVIKDLKFQNIAEKRQLDEAHFSKEGVSVPYQIMIRGKVSCQNNFQFRISDDGEIIAGNAFGSLGLIKCSMRNGFVMRLRLLD